MDQQILRVEQYIREHSTVSDTLMCKDDGTFCWIWDLSGDVKGYGKVTLRTEPGKARRLSYKYLVNVGGEIPDVNEEGKRLVVRHMCHHPSCVNPLHLKIGDDKDNAEDKKLNGTFLSGEKGSNAKLTKQQAEDVIQSVREGRNHSN